MGKFLEKIVDYKSRTGVEDPFADVKQDLSFIETDTNVWRDIQTEEVQFLRRAIGVFTGPEQSHLCQNHPSQ